MNNVVAVLTPFHMNQPASVITYESLLRQGRLRCLYLLARGSQVSHAQKALAASGLYAVPAPRIKSALTGWQWLRVTRSSDEPEKPAPDGLDGPLAA